MSDKSTGGTCAGTFIPHPPLALRLLRLEALARAAGWDVDGDIECEVGMIAETGEHVTGLSEGPGKNQGKEKKA